MAISNRPWDGINKSRLPKACFLWIRGPESESDLKKNWVFPVYEGTGGINPETGMYRRRGNLNRNAVRAAYAYLHGARTGTPMTVPAAVRAKIISLGKRCGFTDWK